MAPECVIASGAQVFFHSRTRRTRTASFQENLANSKPSVFQGNQVNPGNDQIPPQEFRRHRILPQQGRRNRQVLVLNQCDLPLRLAASRGMMIAVNPGPRAKRRGRNRHNRRTPLGTDADPFQSARPGKRAHEIVNRLHRDNSVKWGCDQQRVEAEGQGRAVRHGPSYPRLANSRFRGEDLQTDNAATMQFGRQFNSFRERRHA